MGPRQTDAEARAPAPGLYGARDNMVNPRRNERKRERAVCRPTEAERRATPSRARLRDRANKTAVPAHLVARPLLPLAPSTPAKL
jgi:hypothetical protein